MKDIQSIKQRYGIIGNAPKLLNALKTAIRVAPTDLTVLITGESGVGKEVFSRIIHDNSPRKHEGFIAINCGAIPSGTINSELFGHEKGAFTGATSDRKGYFETYNGGVLFLDEIGEMPMDTQSYLLRILESGEFIRVGSSKVKHTDVRIIAATNVDLHQKIAEGKFREDLYYRLNTVPIYLPPLRERKEDIYMLFRRFANETAEKYRKPTIQLDEQARLLLERYNWPGNIRELKNITEQLSILSENTILGVEELRRYLPNVGKSNLPAISPSTSNEQSFQEREILYKILFDMKGDLNELKDLVFELIKNNNLKIEDMGHLKKLGVQAAAIEDFKPAFQSNEDYPSYLDDSIQDSSQPVLLNQQIDPTYGDVEIIEENLSLEEHTKKLIIKALKKYNGRRKEAAQDLGISERTLYRKIKEYELE